MPHVRSQLLCGTTTTPLPSGHSRTRDGQRKQHSCSPTEPSCPPALSPPSSNSFLENTLMAAQDGIRANSHLLKVYPASAPHSTSTQPMQIADPHRLARLDENSYQRPSSSTEIKTNTSQASIVCTFI